MNAFAWLAVTALVLEPLVTGGLPRGVAIAGTVGCVLIGVHLAVRGYWAGAVLEPETLVVRGFFRTRRIPKASITGITEFPAVRWKRADGKARWSPIIAFCEEGQRVPSFVRRHNEMSIQRLREWDHRRHLKARRSPAKKRQRG
ncbi:hypothetical protein F1D05_22150 [Kribbella qitaiheensis]|uniref:PH domain-containing protein n=1 Tax=Kribbella qitaiheensis TaxID=1544730 RepID=A0A7G6X1K6_9ACTN|nr:hypothetical protein [Kribbella qitaiheensis]QNE20121.1 hypothetical protein F1D05_22150 [Kribbella qitaiheensis]